jgi:putative endonuclease
MPVSSPVIPAHAGIQGGRQSLATDATSSLPSFRRTPESRRPTVPRQPAVYILASQRNGTLYIGVTSELTQRVWQHKNDVIDGFTRRYSVHQLVWYELHETMESAIKREKALKNWKRVWKLQLIENSNPGWQDLYDTIV